MARQTQAPTQTVATARQTRSGPCSPGTPKRMAPAEARYLCNWLSTRVDHVASGVVVAPEHAYERALVASRLAKARELGLTVVPGAYVPSAAEKRPAPGHLVRCPACAIEYHSTHYHCCQCGRVMRMARSFEAHASGAAGRCAGDEQLARRGLRVVAGVWRRSAPTSLSAAATSRAS